MIRGAKLHMKRMPDLTVSRRSGIAQVQDDEDRYERNSL